MVNWNLVWVWTKRIAIITGIIILAITFLGFLPRINQLTLFPDYTNLIWFFILLAIGLLLTTPFLLNFLIDKIRLRRLILGSLNENVRINDKDLSAKVQVPVWKVTPLFKKLAPKLGLLVSFSGTPTFFHSNFIDRFIKYYEEYGDLGRISREFAQRHSINISKDDLDLILDELIYMGNEKAIKLAEKWKKEEPKRLEEAKKPTRTVIKRLGETRRKKKK